LGLWIRVTGAFGALPSPPPPPPGPGPARNTSRSRGAVVAISTAPEVDQIRTAKTATCSNDEATADNLGALADTAAAHARNVAFLTQGASYFEKAGFLKLREISVSYTLPRTLTQGIFSSLTQDVRLEVSGRNLKTWTPYTGYDPEVSNFSNQNIGRFQDVTPYPPSRSVFISLSTTF